MITEDVRRTLDAARDAAGARRHEYVTLEHLLFALLEVERAQEVIRHCGGDPDEIRAEVDSFLENRLEKLPEGIDSEVIETVALRRVIEYAILQASGSGQERVDGGNLLAALYQARDSHAVHILRKANIEKLDVLNYLAHGFSRLDDPEQDFEVDEDFDEEAARDPLARFTTNLNELAAQGQIDPLVGRQVELERTIQTLTRRRKNNPLLVGEPGVGKTAIAEGLALRIHEGNVPEGVRDAEVFALDMGAVLAGTKYRGQFEQRFKGVIAALERRSHAILFIDEIHTIVGAGATSGGTMDASNILKPALAGGRVRCVGSTTFAEYKAAFDRDRALARRFQKIEIGEPTIAETVMILEGLQSRYEEHHGVRFSPEAIQRAAELAAKYLHDRHLPDKAIDVIDEAGARIRLLPKDQRPDMLGEREIEAVIATMARIPTESIEGSEKERLRHLDEDLRSVIFGQDHAIAKVVSMIKLSRAGLGSAEKPVGSFLFSGPTGVGKTELAKQLAQFLGIEFIRFDMSEYTEPHTVSRLIGAPPGYVGFDQGGLLTEAINRTPHAVLVLDEIEKAHPNLFNLLLQVMDHATLTDNNGRKADFRNIVLIMTTNAGADELSGKGIGFESEGGKGKGRAAIERTFSPEFRNRLDAWVAFEPLDLPTIARVVEKFVEELRIQLRPRNVELVVTPAAVQWLAAHGFDRLNGARPMGRLIQKEIKEPLVETLLYGDLQNGGRITVDSAEGALTLRSSPAG
jgi:ATP-dependent Clp protease ATP-binding subunit ClpA